MPRLRSTRYLTCFYCGKRTNTRYDGITREFLCLNCDATNYLDENGDITDPPVATEREAPAPHYANLRASSPAISHDSIFCSTCLKNQRLFTASLAQYLPDDPSHPEYPELERNYYRYRKGLEQRYPQVCEECAETVEAQIRKAGYTAKTDHLRRMMEKSKGRRVEPGRTSMVDWANSLGKTLRWVGLMLQMLWHVRCISQAMEHADDGMYDPDDRSWPILAVISLKWVVEFLPPAETLISSAILASVLSVWWNPQFVQVSRGFSRHLLGFTQWYAFQALIVFCRVIFRRVLDMDGGSGRSKNAQVSAHLVTAVVMIFIYFSARRSIRVDTTPLFGNTNGAASPKVIKPAKRKQQDSKTFSELLNEALDTPQPAPKPMEPVSRPIIHSFSPSRSRISPRNPPDTELRIKSLGINPPTPQRAQQLQYPDEMDWSPTQAQSQHRAFRNTFSSNGPLRPFGEAPTQPESSPFWYKVPPAPVAPAQRLRNPPNAPIMRSRPAEKENIFFRGPTEEPEEKRNERDSSVTFSQPRFFAPTKENDEANSLADLLGSSFTLSQEQEDETNGRASRPPPKPRRPVTLTEPFDVRSPRAVGSVIVASLLFLWLLTVTFSMPFGRELQLAILTGAIVVAMSATGDARDDMDHDQAPAMATYVGSALGVVELALVCWLWWETWNRSEAAVGYGIGALGMMLGHQVWNTIM